MWQLIWLVRTLSQSRSECSMRGGRVIIMARLEQISKASRWGVQSWIILRSTHRGKAQKILWFRCSHWAHSNSKWTRQWTWTNSGRSSIIWHSVLSTPSKLLRHQLWWIHYHNWNLQRRLPLSFNHKHRGTRQQSRISHRTVEVTWIGGRPAQASNLIQIVKLRCRLGTQTLIIGILIAWWRWVMERARRSAGDSPTK